MTHFPPSPSVLAPVQLTRAAYAQLQGQVFHPPRIFGPEWHVREGEELDKERRWRDLGVKIATGFEIMYKEGGRKGRSGKVSHSFVFNRESTADNVGRVAQMTITSSKILRIGHMWTTSSERVGSGPRWKEA